mmetsp:Transcript_31946/g.51583  ORF Transcript_31946/g.51583 Transcript_31946/m.51583 type:complete len:464 (-) Transcript_31946:554-1945(-)|eukprot:CAMPEP_0184662240 /NCGR_PEP_ID=MMETSP0308-20130426/42198_1 /TAXON_ID=38269 /ORGANISM="Gloeochaete witrockiana, Strain SAG 46.84" /LENGTH=463 /DNA_ID=CAMNT_0027104101 /DNA_START=140 /DNA_END=1531 /DNA_ORIENTATION=-
MACVASGRLGLGGSLTEPSSFDYFTTPSCGFDNLPEGVISVILRFLDIREKVRLARTCKQWLRVAFDAASGFSEIDLSIRSAEGARSSVAVLSGLPFLIFIARRGQDIVSLNLSGQENISPAVLSRLVAALPVLQHLDLSACSVNDFVLGAVGSKCKQLEVLRAQGCSEISEHGVRALCASGAWAVADSGVIVARNSRLRNLNVLDLGARGRKRENALGSLPGELQMLASGLTELDVSGRSLTTLPPEVSQLVRLKVLSLKGNDLTSLPDSLSALKSLTTLDASRNRISQFCILPGLTRLSLASNPLRELQTGFGNMSSLMSLDLSYCDLDALPEDFGNLSKLHDLNLSSNTLRVLPKSFTDLSALRVISLARNSLESFPPQLLLLPLLQDVELHDNTIASIPASARRFGYLNMTGNPLQMSPEVLMNWKGLRIDSDADTIVVDEYHMGASAMSLLVPYRQML